MLISTIRVKNRTFEKKAAELRIFVLYSALLKSLLFRQNPMDFRCFPGSFWLTISVSAL